MREATLIELGGVSRIVRDHVNDVMGTLTAEEQALCARLFDRLVTAIGSKIAFPTAGLAADVGVSEHDVEVVLNKLIPKEARILKPVVTSGLLGFEIFHDVLGLPVLEWKRDFEVRKKEAELERRLVEAGDQNYFAWPPARDPNRPPYRGLRPLEAEDAGIFFGREAAVFGVLDRLRALRETTPPRLFVIVGASGSGKSSFLRAGLIPRLMRDDRNFLPLPIIRPERAAIHGEAGLLSSLEAALAAAQIAIPRGDLRRLVIQTGAARLKALLQELADKATSMAPDGGAKSKPPTLILSIDQAEKGCSSPKRRLKRSRFSLCCVICSRKMRPPSSPF